MKVQVATVTDVIATGQSWVQVDLSITNGKLDPTGLYLSGSRIYEQNDASDSGYTRLSVFTDADGDISVNVRPDRDRTATVTAQISGVSGDHASHTVTYFDDEVRMERVSGNYQHARTGDRLPEPLVVRVSDGDRPVRDQRVRFNITSPVESGGRLYPTSSSLFIREGGTPPSEEGTDAISVKTDSRGEAKVYLTTPTVPATGGTLTVSAVVAATPPPPPPPGTDPFPSRASFTVFAVRRQTSTLTITKTDSTATPVESSDPNYNPIYLTISQPHTEVEFTITGGQLYLAPALLDLDATSLNQPQDRPRYVSNLKVSADASRQIGTATSPVVFARVNSGIATLTARIPGSSEDDAEHVIQIITGSLNLIAVSGGSPRVGGALGGLRSAPFVVRAEAGGSPAPGQIVKFGHTVTSNSALVPVPGTKVYTTDPYTLDGSGTLRPASDSVVVVVSQNEEYVVLNGTPIFVQTDSNGEAKVYLQMGTVAGEDHSITATLPVGSESVSFTVQPRDSTIAARLKAIDVPDPWSSDNDRQTLAVRVENLNGDRLPGVNVRFTTTHGTIAHQSGRGVLTNNQAATGGTDYTDSGQEIFVLTNSFGEVWVTYVEDPDVSGQTVRAEIASEQGAQDYDFEVSHLAFDIDGGGRSTNPGTNTPRTINPYLSISLTSSNRNPGETGSLTVVAYGSDGDPDSNVPVSLSATGITFLSSTVRTGEPVSFTIPSSNTTIFASALGGTYSSARAPLNITSQPDRLVRVSGTGQSGAVGAQLSSDFVVRVEDRNGRALNNESVTFAVTAGGGRVSATSVLTNSSGEARTRLTLGSSPGTNTVEARVSGVSSVTFSATAAAVAEDIVIYSGDDQTGLPNRRLPESLIIQVVDDDDNGVEDVLVTFSVVGGVTNGRVSPSRVRTDDDGFAETNFTPRSATGAIEIDASAGDLSSVTFTVNTGEPPAALVYVSGKNQNAAPGSRLPQPFVVEVLDRTNKVLEGITVTFRVTAGGGTLSTASATTGSNGRAQTVLTLGEARGDNAVQASVSGVSEQITFKAGSEPEVSVNASQRPPMYWVDNTAGTLHRLVDAKVENLASGVQNATSIAVDTANGHIYWTAQTGANRGAIRRAGLNGGGVQTLKTLTSAPMGIAVDSAGGTVYWTNSRGRIQSMPTSGGKITNVLQNLSSPGPIALSNGVLYWGEATGSVRRMSLSSAQKVVLNIATGLGEPLSIAISKGKIYWIERSAGGGGRIQRAGFDGTGIQQLKAFQGGVPIGFTVDSSENKIYWTRSTGKIQRANLMGKFVKDIVSGLMNPGSIALGTEVMETPAPVVEETTQTTRKTQTTSKADNSKYDVNDDGAVDNIDVTLVAVSLGTSNAKYDVNGDGTVDVSDLRAVIANTDDAAAAPTIDVDFTALNVDMLQAQIDMLLASGDTSLAGQRTLAYLQHLLASARPDTTVLLANYPNPFNPETWIPYHLATGTDVQVSIYNAQGILVRVLTLGHQTAGYYTSRSRAAYWDGRNALGESVASGIYFFQLQTDEMSLMRKMVILK